MLRSQRLTLAMFTLMTGLCAAADLTASNNLPNPYGARSRTGRNSQRGFNGDR